MIKNINISANPRLLITNTALLSHHLFIRNLPYQEREREGERERGWQYLKTFAVNLFSPGRVMTRRCTGGGEGAGSELGPNWWPVVYSEDCTGGPYTQ